MKLIFNFTKFKAFSIHSIDLILEAFKDQVTLRILELSNLIFLLELIVLHRGAHVIGVGGVFWVEHVSTEIENGLLVAAFVIALADLLHAKSFDEL